MSNQLPVWLASYPKSGSTWFRLMVRHVVGPRGSALQLNDVADGAEAASDAVQFEATTLLDSNLLTASEIQMLLPGYRQTIAAGALGHSKVAKSRRRATMPRLVKCHDAWCLNAAGEPMMGGSSAAASALLLIRDPRDIAVSLAAHHSRSIDETIQFMGSDDAYLSGPRVAHSLQLQQPLLSWSGHADSWLSQREIPVLLLRYEDMLNDSAGTLRTALRFARIPSTPERCHRAAAACSFHALQQQERISGFIEALRWDQRFFRDGRSGGWRQNLTPAQVRRIQRDHGRTMLQLGYALE